MISLDRAAVRAIVAAALAEDLGHAGDITTLSVIPPDHESTARLVARQDLIVAGLPVAAAVFGGLDRSVVFEPSLSDGERAEAGRTLATVRGSTRTILTGERTALNFLMRMCGIASLTRAAVDEVAGYRARILDTRKTVPGLRLLDKYSVAVGGGTNHRAGLYDAVMIKDTHLDCGISISEAVARSLGRGHPADRITVEVREPQQLEEAIAAGAGRALLDNMDLPALRESVRRAGGRIVLEASGGLRPGALREVAETGVDFISVGSLTHSVPAADVAMETEAPA